MTKYRECAHSLFNGNHFSSNTHTLYVGLLHTAPTTYFLLFKQIPVHKHLTDQNITFEVSSLISGSIQFLEVNFFLPASFCLFCLLLLLLFLTMIILTGPI